MEYLGIESKINPENEKDAIVRFLDRYWDITLAPEETLPKMVDYILDSGIKYGIAYQERELQEKVNEYNSLVDLLSKEGKKADRINFIRTTSNESIEFNFSLQIDYLKPRVVERWRISAQPKGYEEFRKAHQGEEFVDMDERLEFEGSELPYYLAAHCLSFEVSLNKGHVFHHKDPLTSLVSAIYQQGMSIGMQVVEQKWGSKEDISDRRWNLLGIS